ncbi:MAG: protein-L-isoaspartate O-methyltransferase [Gammaproteobacteria bacterium]|jgi:protein-L-isoaspartate(D-aspartate) O-methyltransferase
MDIATAREQMIGQQLRAWEVLDERILDIMAAIPRERFVPPEWRTLAYADAEIPLAAGKLLAPPKLQGRALQALQPGDDDNVLEIGCGTGYLTACLACLAHRVTAVELHPELAAAARDNLAALGIRNAEVVEGDGLAMEFPPEFDVICVNGSLPAPDTRLARLLRPGGRLFLVAGRPPVMEALRVTRRNEDDWTTEAIFETCLPPLENARQPLEFVF